jgi:SAM-dependent methyltransferase
MDAESISSCVQPALTQPTDPQLIWGRRQDRLDQRFRTRAAVVESLISSWTKPDWSAVDVSGGAGRWLSTLAPKFRQFTHLDLSARALSVAQADHPELPRVEFGIADLLKPKEGGEFRDRTWDVAFCFDTLLYRGSFAESALQNIRHYVRPGGIVIIDVPLQLRASISRLIKGRRYGGPERTLSVNAALSLVRGAGYECLATACQYRELPPSIHRFLAEKKLTNWIPWPGTWMYLVLRVSNQA